VLLIAQTSGEAHSFRTTPVVATPVTPGRVTLTFPVPPREARPAFLRGQLNTTKSNKQERKQQIKVSDLVKQSVTEQQDTGAAIPRHAVQRSALEFQHCRNRNETVGCAPPHPHPAEGAGVRIWLRRFPPFAPLSLPR
jgi:hypothetical protein